MNTSVLIVGGIVLVAMFILLNMLYRPVRAVFALILNTILGWAGLYIFNFLVSPLGLVIGINLVSATTVGVLGIPGLILLIILKLIYK